MHIAPERKKPGVQLHVKVFIGFMLGALLGVVVHIAAPGAVWVQDVIHYVARPVGTVFLNLLFMMVVPLIFSALVLGVAELGDIASLGRLGWRTLIYTAVVTGIAVLIGLAMANLLQPGAHMDAALVEQALSSNATKAGAIVEKGRELNLVDIIVHRPAQHCWRDGRRQQEAGYRVLRVDVRHRVGGETIRRYPGIQERDAGPI